MAINPSTTPEQLFEGETPSPLCNHLLEQVRLRYEGELDEKRLVEDAQQAIKSLEEARDQALRNLEENGASEDVVDAFERSFEEMQLALEEVMEFAGSVSEDSYESVRLAIFRAATATVFAMTTMQQAQFVDGPTDMPLFNALFKMKDRFLEGNVEEEQLKQALNGIVQMTKSAIEELLKAEGEQPPQRDGLVRAYREQIASLETAGKRVSEGDKSGLEAAFQQLLKTSEGVKEAMLSLSEAVMGEGPCRLRRTNILLTSLRALREGAIAPEQFALGLEAYEGELREEYARFLELRSMPNQQEAVAQEVGRAQQAYEMHERAFEHLIPILEGEVDPAQFELAESKLIEASEALSDSKEALIELGEREGKVSCVRCGTLNEPSNRVCGSCNAQLPQQAGGTMSSTLSFQEADGQAQFGEGELEMTTNLERLFVAVNEIAEDRSSDEEFEEVLVWMDGLLENAASTMPEVPVMTNNPDYSPELIEQIEILQEELNSQRDLLVFGMNDFRVALGTLQDFLTSRDKDDLIRGVREVKGAAIKMQQAERALAGITEAIKTAYTQREEGDGVPASESSSGRGPQMPQDSGLA